ncbi:hypothetical protein B0T16DRAFT_405789 [Cercophora newfieldiana]|uniref:Uncharacterized protein n=1 Tax=Cercophora newfieldiana TaxID=92897 RepID=A0AA39YIS0_9PEZI|nr:hypothetical protein B0T16DRAFT_405789 [Cercophora newfieldiana]
MSSYLESLSKWIQLKIYQLEVTYSVYIFTPIEKFIFYSVLFLLFSLTFIATVLYLPHHVQFILSRAWFYMHGDAPAELGKQGVVTAATAVAGKVAEATASVVREL